MAHHDAASRRRMMGAVDWAPESWRRTPRLGDRLVYYELDRVVEDYARKYFTFSALLWSGGGGRGPARRRAPDQWNRKLAARQPGGYDLLVLDAFSSDAIPVHLLTRRGSTFYARHLAPHGLLAVHVTNRHSNSCRWSTPGRGYLAGATRCGAMRVTAAT